MTSQDQARLGYFGALFGTAAHLGYNVWQGPQPNGEQPLASPALSLANHLGFWALAWLCASLACTPLRLWTGAVWPGRWRKRFGVTAFALSVLHVATWVVGEKSFHVSAMVQDFADKPWLIAGALASLCLWALALTTPAVIARRLGGVRWRLLHRLVYVAAGLAIAHYALRPNANVQHWLAFAVLIVLLLFARRRGPLAKPLR